MRMAMSILTGALLAATSAWAGPLAPGEVLMVSNSASGESVAVAEAYARERGIPKENILSLRLPAGQTVTREEYEKLIRQPVAQAVAARPQGKPIRCVCLIYGVPLRIEPPPGPEVALREICRDYLKETRARLTRLVEGLGNDGPAVEAAPGSAGLDDLFRQADALLVRRLAPGATAAPSRSQDARRGSSPAASAPARGGLADAELELHGLRGMIDLLGRQRLPGAGDVEALRRDLRASEAVLAEVVREKPGEAALRRRLAIVEKTDGLSAAVECARGQLETLRPTQPDASVDSELALAMWDRYDVEGPLPNPLHWRSAGATGAATVAVGSATRPASPVLMTSRLDGPCRGDVMRMIKSSLAAEKSKEGLWGRFYINTGGPLKEYDTHLRTLADNVKTWTKVPVTVGTRLFAPQSCPEAALYVGWHSPRKYIPSMMWAPGAVGWHVAGCEARDIRNPQSPQWCPQMIQNGVAATLGAIGEPTLAAFPVPEDFFGLLLTGKLTIAECYWRTSGTVSWKMVLLADPLYNPFAAKSQLDPARLPKGLMP